MTPQARDWSFWLGVALVALMLLCGCISPTEQEAHSRVAEHVKQLVNEIADVKRATPADSPAAHIVETAYWRAADRLQPMTAELRRISGSVGVDIPRTPMDNRQMVEENRLLDDLASVPPQVVQPPFAEGGGLGGVLGLAGGGGGAILTALAIARQLLRKKLQEKDKRTADESARAQQAREAAREMHVVINELKARGAPFKDAVRDAVKNRPLVQMSYELAKFEDAREAQRTEQRYMPGINEAHIR